MTKPDGGAAFPQSIFHDEISGNESFVGTKGGMSLRDYFAAQMMGGVFAGGHQVDIAREVRSKQRAFEMGLSDRQIAMETNKLIATMAYEVADAMIAEREK